MKITLVTDTWLPSINGVVTTLTNTVEALRSWGHTVQVIEPSLFRTIGAPGYPEVRLSWNIWCVGPMIEQFQPDAIHIATEGPLGLAARWYCKVEKRSIPHNTSYHTKFPEYLHHHYGIPESWGYWWMRIFHKFSTRVLVTNQDMADDLTARGLY
jgi:glycosyltransferase involved in cell wall biosynthesis